MINVELHCHTYHSSDSLMLPQQILDACERRGIDRVAITDHNSLAGALETHALDPERVIIGEEILTTEGEILGYFMKEEIPEGLPPMEVVEQLTDQGAVISISHPFDLTRGGRLTQTGGCVIVFARFKHESGSLARLTQADGQHPGGERIQTSGMPGFACLEYSPDFL